MVEPKTTFDYVGEIWSIADWVRDVTSSCFCLHLRVSMLTEGLFLHEPGIRKAHNAFNLGSVNDRRRD